MKIIELNSDNLIGSGPRTIPPMREDIITLKIELEKLIMEVRELGKVEDKIGLLADAISDNEDKIEALPSLETIKSFVTATYEERQTSTHSIISGEDIKKFEVDLIYPKSLWQRIIDSLTWK